MHYISKIVWNILLGLWIYTMTSPESSIFELEHILFALISTFIRVYGYFHGDLFNKVRKPALREKTSSLSEEEFEQKLKFVTEITNSLACAMTLAIILLGIHVPMAAFALVATAILRNSMKLLFDTKEIK